MQTAFLSVQINRFYLVLSGTRSLYVHLYVNLLTRHGFRISCQEKYCTPSWLMDILFVSSCFEQVFWAHFSFSYTPQTVTGILWSWEDASPDFRAELLESGGDSLFRYPHRRCDPRTGHFSFLLHLSFQFILFLWKNLQFTQIQYHKFKSFTNPFLFFF